MTIGYNVETKDEVKKIYEKLKIKRVKIVKEPSEPQFGGLFFYFEDIEGNLLEIASNPYIIFDKENNVVGHKSFNDF